MNRYRWQLRMRVLACAAAIGCSVLAGKAAESDFPWKLVWKHTVPGTHYGGHKWVAGTVYAAYREGKTAGIVIYGSDGSTEHVILPAGPGGSIAIAVAPLRPVMYVRVGANVLENVEDRVYAIESHSSTILWESHLDARGDKGDVFAFDDVVVASDIRGVQFLGCEDGRRLWKCQVTEEKQLANMSCDTFEYRDGVLYFGDEWFTMYAVDVKQRRLLWGRKLPWQGIGVPVIHDHNLYHLYLDFNKMEKVLQCYEWKTGNLVWERMYKHTTGRTYDAMHMCIIGSNVFHATETHVVGNDIRTGKQIVKWSLEGGGRLGGPVAVKDLLLLTSTKLGLFAVDWKSGRVKWRSPRPCSALGIEVSEDGQRLLLISGDGDYEMYEAKKMEK